MQSSIQRSSVLLGTLRARPRQCSSFFSNQHALRRSPRSARSFSSSPYTAATHQETPSSSLLSQALDQRRRAAGNARADTAGPFVLGVTQKPYDQSKVKKWSELTTKGKVIRTTQRTSNATVILLGAGLTAVLIYALASELFARNSPTVLYGEACSRITKSPEIAQYLPGSLVFHNNPPSATRPRHRNRNVSSQLAQDSSGREHLLLNFYVRNGSPPSSEGYLARLQATWTRLTEGSFSWDLDLIQVWVMDVAHSAQDQARKLFLYLTGENGSSSSKYPFPTSSDSGPQSLQTSHRDTRIGRGESDGGFWSNLTGLFSGIGKGVSGGNSSSSGRKDEWRETYEEGEVHCDLMKNDNGDFEWRYIIVDMPNSRARYPHRIFVERAPGVRENEAVMRWS